MMTRFTKINISNLNIVCSEIHTRSRRESSEIGENSVIFINNSENSTGMYVK